MNIKHYFLVLEDIFLGNYLKKESRPQPLSKELAILGIYIISYLQFNYLFWDVVLEPPRINAHLLQLIPYPGIFFASLNLTLWILLAWRQGMKWWAIPIGFCTNTLFNFTSYQSHYSSDAFNIRHWQNIVILIMSFVGFLFIIKSICLPKLQDVCPNHPLNALNPKIKKRLQISAADYIRKTIKLVLISPFIAFGYYIGIDSANLDPLSKKLCYSLFSLVLAAIFIRLAIKRLKNLDYNPIEFLAKFIILPTAISSMYFIFNSNNFFDSELLYSIFYILFIFAIGISIFGTIKLFMAPLQTEKNT